METRSLPVPNGLVGERVDSAIAKLLGFSRTFAAEESLMFSLPNEIRRDLKAAGMSDKMRHDAAFEEAGSLH